MDSQAAAAADALPEQPPAPAPPLAPFKPIAAAERIEALDVVRGFALLGIFLGPKPVDDGTQVSKPAVPTADWRMADSVIKCMGDVEGRTVADLLNVDPESTAAELGEAKVTAAVITR